MADKDFVIKNGLVVGDTATINGVQIDPSGATSGQFLKFDGSKFVPGTSSDSGQSISYEETIGNNSATSFTVTHNLGTKDLNVIVRQSETPYDVVDVRWEATTPNTVTLDFSSAPGTDSKRVIIKGPGTKEYYSQTIGDGSNTSITITHNLGSRNIVPVLRNVNSPYEAVQVLAQATTVDSVTFDFSSAPDSSSLLASVYLLDISNSSTFTIGDGSTTEFTVTHNLNTRDIGVTCRATGSPYDFISVRWEALTVNTAKVIFSSAPATNSRRIGVYKSVGGSKDFNAEFSLIDGDVTPALDNVYSLGTPELRWKSVSIGGGTLYITDSGNNNQVAITVSNGVFNVDGIAQAQLPNVAVTNLTFSDNTVQTTAAIGLPSGGVTNQLLAKSADTDYSVQWINEAPAASYTSQVKHLVKNDDSVTLTKGMVVYTSGANGNNILVKRAIATSDITSSQVLGFVEANIAVNGTGYVVNNGLISNINTNSAGAVGDPVWLSPSTAGSVVYGLLNKPDAPNHLVYLGVVNRKNASTGAIFVHVSNGWELNELHNVSASSPVSGDFLKYNGSVWVNDAINLGTDTTGDYISSLVAGTGITLSNNSGEGATPTITVNTSVIAAIDSPSLTGTPLAPTAANTTNNTQIATTAYVKTVINDLINSAPATLDTLGEIATSLANNASLSSSLTSSIALKAPLADPTFTGTVTIPAGASISGFATLANPTFTGTVTLPDNTVALGTKTTGDYVASLVAGTGITLSNNSGETSTPTIAVNTSVIQSRVSNVSDTEIGYLDGVTSAIQTQLDAKAPITSPTFTGTVVLPATSAGGAINPSATNTYDLGTASLRWRNIYTQDLHLNNGIGDYTVIEGEENLYLVNNKTNRSFKFALIEVDRSEVPKASET